MLLRFILIGTFSPLQSFAKDFSPLLCSLCLLIHGLTIADKSSCMLHGANNGIRQNAALVLQLGKLWFGGLWIKLTPLCFWTQTPFKSKALRLFFFFFWSFCEITVSISKNAELSASIGSSITLGNKVNCSCWDGNLRKEKCKSLYI